MTTERTSVAVVVRVVRDWADGDVRTTYYGPFLPHAGSAVDQLIANVMRSGRDNPEVLNVDCYVETVYIGEGESDAAVVAVR